MTKSLIVSTHVILLLFALSSLLSFLCMKTVNELKTLVLSLPDSNDQINPSDITKIHSLWTSRRYLISFVLKHDLLFNTDVSVKTLCAYAGANANVDYLYAKYALISSLEAIAQVQEISFYSVF